MLNRRNFIIASGLTALASTRVLGANDTLRLGVIGAGQRMRGLLDVLIKSVLIRSSPSATSTGRIAMQSKNAPTVSPPRIWIIAKCWRRISTR